MKKERKDETFLKNPYYEGGNKALSDFIQVNMIYPKDALEAKVEGVVRIRYDIDYLGNVKDAVVIAGLGFGCDEEAVRITKLLKFIVPKTPRKLKVTFHKNLNVHFRLPHAKQETPKNIVSASIQYQLTTIEKPSPINEEKKQGQTYTYTIKF